jgi:hypothetical protein
MGLELGSVFPFLNQTVWCLFILTSGGLLDITSCNEFTTLEHYLEHQ